MNKLMMVVVTVTIAAVALPVAAFETAYDGLLWTNGVPGQIAGVVPAANLKHVSAQVPTLKGVIAIEWSDGKLTVCKPQGME